MSATRAASSFGCEGRRSALEIDRSERRYRVEITR